MRNGGDVTAKNPRGTRRYQQAVRNLKAQGDAYCWRGCGTYLYANAPWPHPQCMTLGHLLALEDGGDPYDTANHMAECIACNMGDGARRTNDKRSGRDSNRKSYTNDEW